MQPYRKNRSLSAHTALHGESHFDATPMVTPGTKTMIHNKYQTRKSWDFHAFYAWCIGTTMKHYRYYRVVSEKTGAEIPHDTVQYTQHIVQKPTITQADRIHKATMELTKSIKNEPSKNTLAHAGAIITLRTILQERKKSTKRTHIN